MLAQTLRTLERDRLLVHRDAKPVIPPRVDCSLTPLGVRAAEQVVALACWIESQVDTAGSRRRRGVRARPEPETPGRQRPAGPPGGRAAGPPGRCGVAARGCAQAGGSSLARARGRCIKGRPRHPRPGAELAIEAATRTGARIRSAEGSGFRAPGWSARTAQPTTVQVSVPARSAPRSPLPLCSTAASNWSAISVSSTGRSPRCAAPRWGCGPTCRRRRSRDSANAVSRRFRVPPSSTSACRTVLVRDGHDLEVTRVAGIADDALGLLGAEEDRLSVFEPDDGLRGLLLVLEDLERAVVEDVAVLVELPPVLCPGARRRRAARAVVTVLAVGVDGSGRRTSPCPRPARARPG
ncbi:hypothetical protein SCALM49S_03907 [Streptomyces californicus]